MTMKSCFSILFISLSSLVFLQANVKTADENLEYLSTIYHDSWAVIIGINQYDNMKDLKYAVSDAADIKEMFINKYDFKDDHIKLILDKEATRENITRGFSEMLKQAGENDRVVIFFAGHGETFITPDGGDMGYLMPTDGDLKDLYLTSISMNQLYEIAAISSAKHILYLVDACYSGLAISQSRGISKNTAPSYLKTITTEKGRQIITAGGKDEEVIENSIWGHSAFTKNLLTGLGKGTADIDGDGIVTANELGDFLAERVHNETDGAHTPKIGRIGTEMGEFIFFNSNDFGDETSFAEYKEKSEARKRQYLTAKKLSWIYPGLGHMKIDNKNKGITLLTIETLSLAMAFVSLNNMNTLNDEKTISYAAYQDWQPSDGSTEYFLRETQYLSDHDAHQSASMQFYGSFVTSLAVWAYNIYDINKRRYNYTDNQHNSIFDFSFTPDNQIVLHIKF